jgi:hypothetical protein
MNADLEIALVGLAGVIVGGIITGGFSYWIAWRKEKADAAAEVRREDTAARRAAWLIYVELHWAEVLARTAVDDKHWWSNVTPFSTAAWQQHRDVLAPRLPLADWFALITAFDSITAMQVARDGALAHQMAKLATDDDTAEMFAAAKRLKLDVAEPAPAIPDDDAVLTTIAEMLPRVTAGLATPLPMIADASIVEAARRL